MTECELVHKTRVEAEGSSRCNAARDRVVVKRSASARKDTRHGSPG